jgi:hypothetical protein
MPRPRKGDQISVRVPTFAKRQLDALPRAVLQASGDKRPSHPEIVAALVFMANPKGLARALRAYRRELDRRGLGDFHR